MTGYQTPYSVLGLRPGAARAEIDDAYRRLIKRHHPDYTGGDGDRAAEINRAYSQLRKQPHRPMPPRPPVMAMPPRRRRGIGQRLFAAGAVVAVVLLARSATTEFDQPWPAFSAGTAPAAAEQAPRAVAWTALAFDEPLATELIDQSVDDAMRLHEADDADTVAAFSRSCLEELRENPSLPRFDACAAYDEAIAILEAGEPAFESGPFNPSAVTARQVGAGRLLSADYIESESRLQQIRTRVHMQLLPRIPDAGSASGRQVVAAIPSPKTRTARRIAEPVEPMPSVRRAAVAAQPKQRVRAAAPAPRRRPSLVPSAQRLRPVPEAARAAPPPASQPPEVSIAKRPVKAPWQLPLASPPASSAPKR